MCLGLIEPQSRSDRCQLAYHLLDSVLHMPTMLFAKLPMEMQLLTANLISLSNDCSVYIIVVSSF